MKNKILLAAAVAVACGAPVVAMADANIYGQFRYSLNSADNDLGAGSTLGGQDNVSLFGLKASVGDGVKAFVHLQTGATANEPIAAGAAGNAFNQRFYFGGLKGGFGTVAYGRMTNAYKMPGFKLDPFYNMSHVSAGGGLAAGGATYGLSPATNGFTNNALQYTSPAMAGLKVNVGLYVDDGANDDHGSNVGVSYSVGGFNAGLQIASNDTAPAAGSGVPNLAADGDAMRFHGGYKGGKWSAGASIELVDESATITNTYTYLTGSINFTDKTKLAVSLGTVSGDTGTAAPEGTGVTAGVFQTVAPKTQVYFSSSMVSRDAAGAAEPSIFSLGAIHKF